MAQKPDLGVEHFKVLGLGHKHKTSQKNFQGKKTPDYFTSRSNVLFFALRPVL
jgi:hypothetical protein